MLLVNLVAFKTLYNENVKSRLNPFHKVYLVDHHLLQLLATFNAIFSVDTLFTFVLRNEIIEIKSESI